MPRAPADYTIRMTEKRECFSDMTHQTDSLESMFYYDTLVKVLECGGPAMEEGDSGRNNTCRSTGKRRNDKDGGDRAGQYPQRTDGPGEQAYRQAGCCPGDSSSGLMSDPATRASRAFMPFPPPLRATFGCWLRSVADSPRLRKLAKE
jgi:hypothetical protein